MAEGGRPPRSGPDPQRANTQQELVRELDRLRRRAAHGSQRATVSLDRLSRLTGIPRSTVHAYVSGVRLPPPDVLDVIVTGLGASADEQRMWADALDRITERPAQPAEPRSANGRHRETPAVPRQLPGRPTGFVGREPELEHLDELSRTADHDADAARIFALTGTGGVGKTALVLTWAHRNPERCPAGQLWVDLRGFGPGAALAPGDALEEMLRAVGVNTAELPSSVDARAALFRTAVAGRRMLLVLDNARDAAHVRPLLPGTPEVTTVITSRNTLRSLVVDGAARIQLKRLRRAEARSLLVAELPAELADSAAMTRIVDRCEGLPLTLRIVRERLAGEPAAEAERIAVQFEAEGRTWLDEFDLPEDAGDVSMRAALRWSYQALPAPAARAFELLPLCLVPTIDVHCMSALLDTDVRTARRLLDVLVSANLLDPGDRYGYRVHDLVVTFAGEVMLEGVASEEIGAARIRLLRAVGGVCESACRHTDPGRPMRVDWPDEGEPSAAPFAVDAAALDWVLAHIDLVSAATVDAADDGPAAYAWLLAERGWRALRWIADVGRMDDAVDVACDAAIAVNALRPATSLNRLRGIGHGLRSDLKEAEAIFRRGIALAVQAGDRANEAVDRQNRALVWAHRGEVDDAIDEMTELVDLGWLPGDERVPPIVNLISLELSRGDTVAAARWFAKLGGFLARHDVSEALALEARLCGVRIEIARDHREGLLEELREIERGCEARRNRELVAECLIEEARFFQNAGQLEVAVAHARRANSFAQGAASRFVQASALCMLAEIERRVGNAHEARHLAEQALSLAQSVQLRHQEALAYLALGQAALQLERVDEADEAANAALQIARASSYRPLATAALEILDAIEPSARQTDTSAGA